MSEAPPESTAPTEGQPPQPTEGQGAPPPPPPPEPVEDDLLKAKRQATHWQREAKRLEKANAVTSTELEALREQQKTAEEKAVDAARKAGRDEADKEWNAKYRSLAVRNKALSVLAGVVRAPDLVLPHLDLGDIEVADDGSINETDLKSRIDAVLEQYPFLAIGATDSPPHPHADLGPRKQAPPSKDVNKALREALGRK